VATRERLLAAARELLLAGEAPSAGAVAAKAGVSRLTVYHHFGSQPGLLAALAAAAGRVEADGIGGDSTDGLRRLIAAACAHWARDPALFRRLPAAMDGVDPEVVHALASALAEADQLRPGCSVREAEDVIAIATSFPAFDRLHRDGRRSPAAVAEILERICAAVLAPS
jgi:AcrR family transcriptional regulator